MIYSIFPNKDATIYEGTLAGTANVNMKYTNTGIDEILEVRKIVSSSLTADTYLSRALVKFDIDWTKISGGSQWSDATPKAYLNLYTTEVSQLDDSNPIFEVWPISGSWTEGSGREQNTPQTLKGVSWVNRFGDDISGTEWKTTTFAVNTTGSNGKVHNGGGNWHNVSNYVSNFAFTDETEDLRADVTTALAVMSESVIANEGFLIMLSSSQEQDTNRYGSFKFFSKQTHTIYPPRLEVCWNDHSHTGTDSYTELDMAEATSVFFYLKHNRGSYKRGSKIRFWCTGREKYPVKTHGTTSAELDIRPVSGTLLQYSVIDAKTNETVIPYDSTYTRVSANSKGNYFDIYADSLFEERYYKIQLRYASGSTDYTYYDIKDLFKVVR